MKKLLWLLGVATGLRAEMTLSGDDLRDGDPAPLSFRGAACGGQDQLPPLHWAGVPEGSASLALTIHSPGGPSPGGQWHWALINLAPDSTGLSPEAGQRLRNDGGRLDFSGPCPLPGWPGHYDITLYALDRRLELPPEATPTQAVLAMYGHMLASARLTLLDHD